MTTADFQVLAVLAAGLYSGALAYAQLSAAPLISALAKAQAGTAERRLLSGLWVLVTGLTAGLGAVGAWWLGAGRSWSAGALVCLATLPVGVYLNALLDSIGNPFEDEPLDPSAIVARWQLWHATLTTVALVVFVWFVALLTRSG